MRFASLDFHGFFLDSVIDVVPDVGFVDETRVSMHNSNLQGFARCHQFHDVGTVLKFLQQIFAHIS